MVVSNEPFEKEHSRIWNISDTIVVIYYLYAGFVSTILYKLGLKLTIDVKFRLAGMDFDMRFEKKVGIEWMKNWCGSNCTCYWKCSFGVIQTIYLKKTENELKFDTSQFFNMHTIWKPGILSCVDLSVHCYFQRFKKRIKNTKHS